MPIMYIHGIAVREDGDAPPLALDAQAWDEIRASLRTHIAPVLDANAPEDVLITRVYWGDLGLPPPGARTPALLPLDGSVDLAHADRDRLAEALEDHLISVLDPPLWADAVAAVSDVLDDPTLRSALAHVPVDEQDDALLGRVQARLVERNPGLGTRLGALRLGLAARERRNRRALLRGVRRPYEAALPVWGGDVLGYLAGRGTPDEPGPIMLRTLHVLAACRRDALARHEPLVAFTHSMGTEVLYDALTAFGPPWLADAARVDFWCSGGGQLGLFLDLEIELGNGRPPRVPFEERVGFLWNAWSSGDVLSFPIDGRLPRAFDTDVTFRGNPNDTHLGYIKNHDFYRAFAAKLATCLPRPKERP